jgi:Icc-related predicted phosphoesterase
MKWLLVGDLHYRLRQYDWIADVAPDVDVVVIAGDLLDVRSAVPLPAQAAAVSAQIGRIGRRGVVLAASGNHDLDSRDAAGEKSTAWLHRVREPGLHVDGDSLMLDGTLFSICPWWDGPNGRRRLEVRLVADAEREKQRWVWVYHSPPRGSPLSWDGRREWGDEVLAEWIQHFQPQVVLTGHVHQAPFVDGGGWVDRVGGTWVFNAGQQPGPVPCHIVIDLGAAEATWFASTQRRTVALDAPQ